MSYVKTTWKDGDVITTDIESVNSGMYDSNGSRLISKIALSGYSIDVIDGVFNFALLVNNLGDSLIRVNQGCWLGGYISFYKIV